MHEGGVTTVIIKNGSHRHPEAFDRAKLHKSIVAACLSCNAPAGHADSIATKVTEAVIAWLENRPEVTSGDIRRIAAQALRTYHPDASYIYEHHRSTL